MHVAAAGLGALALLSIWCWRKVLVWWRLWVLAAREPQTGMCTGGNVHRPDYNGWPCWYPLPVCPVHVVAVKRNAVMSMQALRAALCVCMCACMYVCVYARTEGQTQVIEPASL